MVKYAICKFFWKIIEYELPIPMLCFIISRISPNLMLIARLIEMISNSVHNFFVPHSFNGLFPTLKSVGFKSSFNWLLICPIYWMLHLVLKVILYGLHPSYFNTFEKSFLLLPSDGSNSVLHSCKCAACGPEIVPHVSLDECVLFSQFVSLPS